MSRFGVSSLCDQLQAGIDGQQLYDAWSGAGPWTPIVKLSERDSAIIARWVQNLVAEERKEVAAQIRAEQPAPNSHLTWESGRNAAARIARRGAAG